MHTTRPIIHFLLLTSFALTQTSAQQVRLVHRWELEPDLGALWDNPVIEQFPVLSAARLASPQLQVALAEAQKAILFAEHKNLAGREPTLAATIARLQAGEKNRLLRLTLTSAAIHLSDGRDAEVLWKTLRDDSIARPVLEEALVRWKSPVALDTWRRRLGDPGAPVSELLTAVAGIAVTGDASDRKALEGLFRSDRASVPVQVAVCRGLGNVSAQDLESLAADVLAAGIKQSELMSALLLFNHSSDSARDLLLRILESENTSARLIAYRGISKNFPALARQLADQLLEQPDNTLRLEAVAVLNRFSDAASVRLQTRALEDRNLGVRSTARTNLLEKAKDPALKEVVDEAIGHLLAGDKYWATVQAIHLAVSLGENERCPRFVALLEHPRSEVSLNAGWALQELADSPEVLEGMFQHALLLTDRLARMDGVSFEETLRLSFVFEAFGKNLYRPATEMLKQYIPKDGHKMGDMSRASAIWALGKILQDSQDKVVAKQLAARYLDPSEADPESDLVKFTSALAMGYIRDPASPEELNKGTEEPPDPIGIARRWALEQFESP